MQTELLDLKKWLSREEVQDSSDLAQVLEGPVHALRAGNLLAFPTETVYGLGAHALLPEAIAKIYEVKGRPSDNPLIVHVASRKQVEDLAQDIPDYTYALIEKLSPGPVTFVLPKRACVPDVVTAGLPRVGLRIPGHSLALTLLRQADIPVAAPSANRSGRPSPTTAEDCWEDLAGLIPYILDGGPCHVGVESTVLLPLENELQILRPGQVDPEFLERFLYQQAREQACECPKVSCVYAQKLAEGETPPAPGMKYRHYAPNARVIAAQGSCLEEVKVHLKEKFEALLSREWVGYFGCQELLDFLKENCGFQGTFVVYGHYEEQDAAARNLFSAFRELDRRGCKWILTHYLPREGVGLAYCNRLAKAAEELETTGGTEV